MVNMSSGSSATDEGSVVLYSLEGASSSLLGVWYLEGSLIRELSAAADKALDNDDSIASWLGSIGPSNAVSTFNRRRTIQLGVAEDILALIPNHSNLEASIVAPVAASVITLQDLARKATDQTSKELERECGTPNLAKSHSKSSFCSLRFLQYKEGATIPPHADNCGYTMLFTTSALRVTQPDKNENIIVPPPAPGQCILLMGKYLASVVNWEAPVHSVEPAGSSGRKALAVCVNADETWPGATSPDMSTAHLLKQASQQHALELSHEFLAKHAPSADAVLEHWRLLAALVEVDDCGRLPSIECKGYWETQTLRYFTFLDLHANYPEEAKGCYPPRVIHHVWLCHMLQPKEYKADCERLLGRVLPHSNERYNLSGCSKFHQLWKRMTGSAFPSEAQLREEMETAHSIPSLEDFPSHRVSADFWKGYDGLANIYNEIRANVPCIVTKRVLLNETRSQYSQYVVAACFSSSGTCSMAPGCAIDLVWHAHQSDPVAYHDAMDSLPRFLNHDPCGKLNPPDVSWKQGTKEKWKDIYGYPIELPGHSIGCCAPDIAPRPDPALAPLQEEPRKLIWWFQRNVPARGLLSELFTVRGLDLGVEDFPTSLSSASIILNHLQCDTTRAQDLCSLLQELCMAIERVDSTPQGPLDWLWPLMDCLLFPVYTILSLPLIAFLIVYAILYCFIAVPLALIGVKMCKVSCPKRPNRYETALEPFAQRFAEFGIAVEFQLSVKGPVVPNHDPWKSPAIIFRRAQAEDDATVVDIEDSDSSSEPSPELA